MTYDNKKDNSVQGDNDDFKQEKLAQERYLNEGGSVDTINHPVDTDLYLSGFYSHKESQQVNAAGQRCAKAKGVTGQVSQWVKGTYERIVDWGKSLRRK